MFVQHLRSAIRNKCYRVPLVKEGFDFNRSLLNHVISNVNLLHSCGCGFEASSRESVSGTLREEADVRTGISDVIS